MRRVLTYAVVGAAAFWVPDIVISAAKRWSLVDALGALLQTFLLPASLFFTYTRYIRVVRAARSQTGPSLSFFMLFGIWVLGPIAIAVGTTFVGGTYLRSPASLVLVLLACVFPPITFMMSTYDGSLFALLAATLVMPILHLSCERDHWVVPPIMKARL